MATSAGTEASCKPREDRRTKVWRMFFAWCAHFKALGGDDTAILAFRNRESVFVRSTLHGPRGATVLAVHSMPTDQARFSGPRVDVVWLSGYRLWKNHAGHVVIRPRETAYLSDDPIAVANLRG